MHNEQWEESQRQKNRVINDKQSGNRKRLATVNKHRQKNPIAKVRVEKGKDQNQSIKGKRKIPGNIKGWETAHQETEPTGKNVRKSPKRPWKKNQGGL